MQESLILPRSMFFSSKRGATGWNDSIKNYRCELDFHFWKEMEKSRLKTLVRFWQRQNFMMTETPHLCNFGQHGASLRALGGQQSLHQPSTPWEANSHSTNCHTRKDQRRDTCPSRVNPCFVISSFELLEEVQSIGIPRENSSCKAIKPSN